MSTGAPPGQVAGAAARDDRHGVPWAVSLRYWCVVVAWMAFMSYMSTDAFSARNTNSYIDPILRYLFPGITNPEIVFAHTVIRKTAHFSEFFVLSLLTSWALRSGRPPRWRAVWMVQALLLAGFFAGFDELHQAFRVDRTPSLMDSGIDFLGAIAAQLCVYVNHAVRGGRGFG